jgi:3-oxoacyl-[acyl-carrier protein] reductase
VRTRWFREGLGEEAALAKEKQFAEATPLRDIAAPEHVAQSIMGFIQSDFVTGQHVIIDGGRMLRGE